MLNSASTSLGGLPCCTVTNLDNSLSIECSLGGISDESGLKIRLNLKSHSVSVLHPIVRCLTTIQQELKENYLCRHDRMEDTKYYDDLKLEQSATFFENSSDNSDSVEASTSYGPVNRSDYHRHQDFNGQSDEFEIVWGQRLLKAKSATVSQNRQVIESDEVRMAGNILPMVDRTDSEENLAGNGNSWSSVLRLDGTSDTAIGEASGTYHHSSARLLRHSVDAAGSSTSGHRKILKKQIHFGQFSTKCSLKSPTRVMDYNPFSGWTKKQLLKQQALLWNSYKNYSDKLTIDEELRLLERNLSAENDQIDATLPIGARWSINTARSPHAMTPESNKDSLWTNNQLHKYILPGGVKLEIKDIRSVARNGFPDAQLIDATYTNPNNNPVLIMWFQREAKRENIVAFCKEIQAHVQCGIGTLKYPGTYSCSKSRRLIDKPPANEALRMPPVDSIQQPATAGDSLMMSRKLPWWKKRKIRRSGSTHSSQEVQPAFPAAAEAQHGLVENDLDSVLVDDEHAVLEEAEEPPIVSNQDTSHVEVELTDPPTASLTTTTHSNGTIREGQAVQDCGSDTYSRLRPRIRTGVSLRESTRRMTESYPYWDHAFMLSNRGFSDNQVCCGFLINQWEWDFYRLLGDELHHVEEELVREEAMNLGIIEEVVIVLEEPGKVVIGFHKSDPYSRCELILEFLVQVFKSMHWEHVGQTDKVFTTLVSNGWWVEVSAASVTVEPSDDDLTLVAKVHSHQDESAGSPVQSVRQLGVQLRRDKKDVSSDQSDQLAAGQLRRDKKDVSSDQSDQLAAGQLRRDKKDVSSDQSDQSAAGQLRRDKKDVSSGQPDQLPAGQSRRDKKDASSDHSERLPRGSVCCGLHPIRPHLILGLKGNLVSHDIPLERKIAFLNQDWIYYFLTGDHLSETDETDIRSFCVRESIVEEWIVMVAHKPHLCLGVGLGRMLPSARRDELLRNFMDLFRAEHSIDCGIPTEYDKAKILATDLLTGQVRSDIYTCWEEANVSLCAKLGELLGFTSVDEGDEGSSMIDLTNETPSTSDRMEDEVLVDFASPNADDCTKNSDIGLMLQMFGQDDDLATLDQRLIFLSRHWRYVRLSGDSVAFPGAPQIIEQSYQLGVTEEYVMLLEPGEMPSVRLGLDVNLDSERAGDIIDNFRQLFTAPNVLHIGEPDDTEKRLWAAFRYRDLGHISRHSSLDSHTRATASEASEPPSPTVTEAASVELKRVQEVGPENNSSQILEDGVGMTDRLQRYANAAARTRKYPYWESINPPSDPLQVDWSRWRWGFLRLWRTNFTTVDQQRLWTDNRIYKFLMIGGKCLEEAEIRILAQVGYPKAAFLDLAYRNRERNPLLVCWFAIDGRTEDMQCFCDELVSGANAPFNQLKGPGAYIASKDVSLRGKPLDLSIEQMVDVEYRKSIEATENQKRMDRLAAKPERKKAVRSKKKTMSAQTRHQVAVRTVNVQPVVSAEIAIQPNHDLGSHDGGHLAACKAEGIDLTAGNLELNGQSMTAEPRATSTLKAEVTDDIDEPDSDDEHDSDSDYSIPTVPRTKRRGRPPGRKTAGKKCNLNTEPVLGPMDSFLKRPQDKTGKQSALSKSQTISKPL